MSGTEPTRDFIAPETRVGDLIRNYPELEEALTRLSPAFCSLRNPLLRRTVAKVATLRQVAKVGGIPLGDLIRTLRRAAGLPETGTGAAEPPGDAAADRPDWFDAARVVKSLDARPLIESGEHPLERVMADLASLGPGEIYELVAPFEPAPLIDIARRKGFRSFSVPEAPRTVRTYFARERY